MSRRRKEKSSSDIKLAHPDRSAPTEETLLRLAQERGLFDEADRHPANKAKRRRRRRRDDEDQDAEELGLSPRAERMMDAILWSISMSMLHFTLDVLVQRQYAMEMNWPRAATRTVQAFLGT
jgi:hypothetical protein